MDAKISPFSLKHEWKLKWETNDKVHENAMNWNSKVEKELLPALAIVGAISSLQLKNIFFKGDNRKISKLCATGKLIRHRLMRNKQEIPIFTLGPTSVEMLKDRMPIVEWENFKITDVLQRLLFFQLISRFKKEEQSISIAPSAAPFVASFIRNGKKIHVLVDRGNEQEILHTLKFYPPSERFIFIKENINYSREVNEYIAKCNVRLTTDLELNQSLAEMFYLYRNGHWVKERELGNKNMTKQLI